MNLLYLSTLTWDEAGGAHNPTRMSRALARRGHRVLYIEPQPSGTRDADRLPIEIVALTELGMTPTELRRAWYGLDSGDVSLLAQNLASRIEPHSHAGHVAVISAPFDPFVRLVPFLRALGCGIVYYAMDDFSAAPALGFTQFAAGADDYLTEHADLVLGVTPHVARTLERFGKYARVIPNGVALESFRAPRHTQRAMAIQRGELTLGFWGTLLEPMFDADLIARVAQARPHWAIHLLGAIDPEPHRASIAARLQVFPNIFFHGAVAHEELAGYAAVFDVCLAPFPDNAFTRGRDPLKVYEYLACHKPVAASYAPQLAGLPAVSVAYSPDEFVRAIEGAARTPLDEQTIDEYLAGQTWDARTDDFLAAVQSLPMHTADANSGAILPSFARPDGQTLMRYVAALERELAQVQEWAQELERQAQTPRGWQRMKRRVLRAKE